MATEGLPIADEKSTVKLKHGSNDPTSSHQHHHHHHLPHHLPPSQHHGYSPSHHSVNVAVNPEDSTKGTVRQENKDTEKEIVSAHIFV